MTQPSLNQLQAENVPHGVDMQIYARVSNTGSFVLIGEIYEMDWDEDEGMVELPVLGSRITGRRRGRYKLSGTLKNYFINASMRQLIGGEAPDGSGVTSPVYHSQRPFERFDIEVRAKISGVPIMRFINVTFGKDQGKVSENTFTEETVTWEAEELYEYPQA